MIKPTYWILRNLKLFYFVPVIIVLVYMPLMGLSLYKTYHMSIDVFFKNMFKQFQLYIPLFSVWWTVFTLKEFMETDGNELLYLYNKPIYILKMQLLVFGLYALHILVFMLGFNLIFGGHYFATLQLIISSFAMTGFAYFISFAFKSTGVAFLFCIVYSITLNVFDRDRHFSSISVFPETREVTQLSVVHIVLVVVAGVVLFSAGFLVSKVRKSYK